MMAYKLKTIAILNAKGVHYRCAIMNMTRNVCKNAHEQSLITVHFSIYKNVP